VVEWWIALQVMNDDLSPSFQFELPDSNTCRQAADHEQYCSVLRCGIDTDLPVKSSSDYEHFFKGDPGEIASHFTG